MNDFLREYVYEKKHGVRRKKGVLIGVKEENGTVCIGFSSCSPRDEFDRYFGNEVAVHRAYKYCERLPRTVPFSIREKLPKFVDRCKRYFKTEDFPSWVSYYSVGN
jgi:hypothetical protein